MNNPRRTFSYVFDVPENRRGPFRGRVSDGFGECLLGSAPEFSWIEFTPAAWKLYARIELKATDGDAPAASVSFTIERGLMTVLRPGDQLHIAAVPALGLSIVHDDFLVAAAGTAEALAHLPLGSEVEFRYPGEDLESRFRKQPPRMYRLLNQSSGPVRGPRQLVEIVVAGESRIVPWGRPTMGSFEFYIQDGVKPGVLQVSIERLKICPETAAHTSALLMDRDGYNIVER